MRLGMRPVGAGGLFWLLATACGESSSGSDTELSSTGAAGTANTGSSAAEASTGTESGSGTLGATAGASTGGIGSVGTSSVGAGGTSSVSCPEVEPPLGASCADTGLSCTFTNCVPPNYRNDHTLTCVQGAWALATEIECLPNCPDTPLVIGSACQTLETPGPCPFENTCGIAEAYCVEGTWSLEPSKAAPDAPVATTCPETAPPLYSDCCPTQTPEFCRYAGGSGSEFLPPDTTTGAQGGGGASSTTGAAGGTGGTGTSGSQDANDSGARGAGATGAMGATGATGASGLCLTCDPTRLEWVVSGACF